MANPFESNMALYYLNAFGSSLANPDDPMQQVGAVTKQTIQAQQQMNLIKKFLAGGGNLSEKEGKINYTGDVSAFLAGDEKSALGTAAPSALTGDVGNLYKPKAAPGGGGGGMDASKLMMMNLLGGGNALNPSNGSLDVSSADLVGLTPENITQALQLKFMSDELEQKRISDIMKMVQKPQPGPAAPIETPGLGKLSLKQWSSLPTDDRSYYLYAASAKQRGDEKVMTKEDWMASTDVNTRIQYLEGLEGDEGLKSLAIELAQAGATKIDIGKREVEKGLGKGQAEVMSPGFSQGVRTNLMKDKANWPDEGFIKQYTDKGLSYTEAETRAQKRMILESMDKQIRQAFKGRKVEFLSDDVEEGKEGWYVDGVFKVGVP